MNSLLQEFYQAIGEVEQSLIRDGADAIEAPSEARALIDAPLPRALDSLQIDQVERYLKRTLPLDLREILQALDLAPVRVWEANFRPTAHDFVDGIDDPYLGLLVGRTASFREQGGDDRFVVIARTDDGDSVIIEPGSDSESTVVVIDHAQGKRMCTCSSGLNAYLRSSARLAGGYASLVGRKPRRDDWVENLMEYAYTPGVSEEWLECTIRRRPRPT